MKIFISHSSHDKWVAKQISKELILNGHETFLDEKDIRTGESIDVSIQTHLTDSDEMLLLLSPASLKSHWVFIELGGAKALGKKVVPILFHIAANEIPQPISSLLCRDINQLEQYMSELEGHSQIKAPPQASITKASELIGRKVKVIDVNLLTEEDKENEPGWIEGMDKYSNREAVITDQEEEWFNIDIDGGSHSWDLSWLITI